MRRTPTATCSVSATQYYILISGRWFRSASLQGPWTFVSGSELPPDFAKIPLDNPKSTVLASVPGTPQAKEALIANSIPQTASITRSEAKLTVQYDGEATFVPIRRHLHDLCEKYLRAGHQGFRQQLLLR